MYDYIALYNYIEVLLDYIMEIPYTDLQQQMWTFDQRLFALKMGELYGIQVNIFSTDCD